MITVYTDGSARYHEGEWKSAYACAIYKDDRAIDQFIRLMTGATINCTELVAVTHAIHACKQKCPNEPLTIMTDSEYVIRGSNAPLNQKANKKEWELFHNITQNQNVRIDHVKAHNGDVYNNHVDNLAKTALRQHCR